jgi:hypothetical protein
MFGARPKLDGAFAVVTPLHGEAAAAFAVFVAALPIVPGCIAVMTVAHVSPSNRTFLKRIA